MDAGIQQRAAMLNSGIVAEYAEAMQAGAQFPPITIFNDGEINWLADGYHRAEAADEVEEALGPEDRTDDDRTKLGRVSNPWATVRGTGSGFRSR